MEDERMEKEEGGLDQLSEAANGLLPQKIPNNQGQGSATNY